MINFVKKIKYFFQFIIILLLFFLFKLVGLNNSRLIASKIFVFFGRFFRSSIITTSNIEKAFPNKDDGFKRKIIYEMWLTYGKILSEYSFIKIFREKGLEKKIEVEGQAELEEIKKNKAPVIFISGHFDNFELMAMHIEKSGIDLAAIYRPLNNKYLNPTMEKIRKNYICKKQIKKGLSGTKEILRYFKDGTSVALMIDQRVSEGIKCNFFNNLAFTTTIPAQFVKKFQAKIVPVYIERKEGHKFKIKFYDFLEFSKEQSIESITVKLNEILEKMIVKNPDQWIWSHNRWK